MPKAEKRGAEQPLRTSLYKAMAWRFRRKVVKRIANKHIGRLVSQPTLLAFQCHHEKGRKSGRKIEKGGRKEADRLSSKPTYHKPRLPMPTGERGKGGESGKGERGR